MYLNVNQHLDLMMRNFLVISNFMKVRCFFFIVVEESSVVQCYRKPSNNGWCWLCLRGQEDPCVVSWFITVMWLDNLPIYYFVSMLTSGLRWKNRLNLFPNRYRRQEQALVSGSDSVQWLQSTIERKRGLSKKTLEMIRNILKICNSKDALKCAKWKYRVHVATPI